MMPKKIFISYRSTERATASALAAVIGSLGDYEVWYDQRLIGGQDWWVEIMTALEQADVVVLALSRAYMESDPCDRERDYAQRLGKPIVPVQIDEQLKIGQLGTSLQRVQIVRFDATQTDHPALSEALATAQARPPAADTARPPAPISPLADILDVLQRRDELKKEQQQAVVDQLRWHWREQPDNAGPVAERLRLLLRRVDTARTVHEEASSLLLELDPPRRRIPLVAFGVVGLVAVLAVVIVLVSANMPQGATAAATMTNTTQATDAAATTAITPAPVESGPFNVSLIYGARDSFVVLVNGESYLSGLTLNSPDVTEAITERFPDLATVGYVVEAGTCLRYTRQGEQPPLPRGCSADKTYQTNLLGTDIFWYDDASSHYRNLALRDGDELVGLCSAANGSGRCDYTGE